MEENLVPWPIDLQHLEPMGDFQTTLRGTWPTYCNCRWAQFGLPFLFGALQTGKPSKQWRSQFCYLMRSTTIFTSLGYMLKCYLFDLMGMPSFYLDHYLPHNFVYYWGRSFLHWLRPARNCSWTGRKSVSIGNVWMATLLAFTATTLNTPKRVRNWLG